MSSCPNHPSETDLRGCVRCGRTFCTNCVVLLRGAYYCVDCKVEQLRDVASGRAGVMLEYASVWQRLLALIVDGLVQTAVMLVLAVPIVLVFVGFGFASG